MTEVASLWDFADPAASEERFRAAADVAEAQERVVLMTQVARALGLQQRFDEGHAVLDDLSPVGEEAAVRISLERGRLLRSAGDPDAAPAYFAAAAGSAGSAGLEALQVDALHMLALVAPPDEQLEVNERALAVARAARSPEARDWDASLLNNIGMVHAEAGDFEAALGSFQEALEARRRVGDHARTRVARWMVGWALRNLGRREEAQAVQQALRAELEALGERDPYVDKELALLQR